MLVQWRTSLNQAYPLWYRGTPGAETKSLLATNGASSNGRACLLLVRAAEGAAAAAVSPTVRSRSRGRSRRRRNRSLRPSAGRPYVP